MIAVFSVLNRWLGPDETFIDRPAGRVIVILGSYAVGTIAGSAILAAAGVLWLWVQP